MNPWLIAGSLGAVIVAFFLGIKTGERMERADWERREIAELTAANDKIVKLTAQYREIEARHAADLARVATNYQEKLDATRKQTAKLVADARAGALRLRDPAAREGTCGGAAAEAVAPAGRRDGEARGELSGEASAFLLALTGEADEVVKQLDACQQVVMKDRTP